MTSASVSRATSSSVCSARIPILPERIHTSSELWAAKSIYGTRQNDGESRKGVLLDYDKKLFRYASIREEIEEWCTCFYSSMMLSNRDTTALGLPNLNSICIDNDIGRLPDWNSIIYHKPETSGAIVEFSILLKEFIIGQRTLSAICNTQPQEENDTPKPMNTSCHATCAGMVINLKRSVKNEKSITISITYQPNQELTKNSAITTSFTLGS